jgi:hypothetical protein
MATTFPSCTSWMALFIASMSRSPRRTGKPPPAVMIMLSGHQ